MTKTGLSIMALLSSFIICHAQITNAKTDTIKILGNCEMCKKTIEKAGNKKKTSKVVWNTDTKLAIITYDAKKTNSDAILKRVALSGYDSEKYYAPDNVYANLHGCCKYERKKTAPTQPVKNEITMQDTNKKEMANQLLEVYAVYFGLKDALVANDGVTASNKAKELFKAIDKVQMDKMAAEQHTVWMKYMTKLSYDAEHIKGVTETEHQREHFNSLSKSMFEVMKVIKPSYAIYYDHCPMYNEGKGANWLSKESTIKNPYYGSQMLSCGKTVETIK